MATEVAPDDDPGVEAALDRCRDGTDPDPIPIVNALTPAQKNRLLFNLVRDGEPVFAKIVIEAGANPNCTDEDGDTPLHLAAMHGCEVLDLLISLGARPAKNGRGDTPLHLCADSLPKASALLKAFPELVNQKNNNGVYPIFDWDSGTFDLFVEFGADLTVVDQDGHSLLRHAPVGWTGTIILSGVKPEKNILLFMVHWPYRDLICLIRAGADINAVDRENGNTPLHYVLMLVSHSAGERRKVNLLLQEGASLSARNREGCTPLHYAAIFPCPDVIRDLFAAAVGGAVGPDEFLNARTNAGDTALHLASTRLDIITILLSLGADINARGADGNTPLHVAVKKMDLATVALYLREGAYTDVRNDKGETPLDSTAAYRPLFRDNKVSRPVQKGLREIIELLKKTNNPAPVAKAAAKKK